MSRLRLAALTASLATMLAVAPAFAAGEVPHEETVPHTTDKTIPSGHLTGSASSLRALRLKLLKERAARLKPRPSPTPQKTN